MDEATSEVVPEEVEEDSGVVEEEEALGAEHPGAVVIEAEVDEDEEQEEPEEPLEETQEDV